MFLVWFRLAQMMRFISSQIKSTFCSHCSDKPWSDTHLLFLLEFLWILFTFKVIMCWSIDSVFALLLALFHLLLMFELFFRIPLKNEGILNLLLKSILFLEHIFKKPFLIKINQSWKAILKKLLSKVVFVFWLNRKS